VDLSYAAAKELGLDRAGVAGVEMQVYEPGKPLPENLNWISVNPSRYGLQLTSSTNIEQIYKTSALLQDKGYNSAYIEANDVGGVTYYSLIVSTVGTHAEAELMRNRLKKTGFDCVIIDFETRELGK
jgi:rare lipoprotein A (peptidoglycan hydrolase)